VKVFPLGDGNPKTNLFSGFGEGNAARIYVLYEGIYNSLYIFSVYNTHAYLFIGDITEIKTVHLVRPPNLIHLTFNCYTHMH
jgi:hypothetical protein